MLVPFRSCVSNMKHMFAGKLFIYRRHSSNSEWNRQKNTVPKLTILSNVFRCILNSNIDKNFAIHNHAKFDYLSHDITVRLLWTTRSSPNMTNMAGFDTIITWKNTAKHFVSWKRLDVLVDLSAASRGRILPWIFRNGGSIVLQVLLTIFRLVILKLTLI